MVSTTLPRRERAREKKKKDRKLFEHKTTALFEFIRYDLVCSQLLKQNVCVPSESGHISCKSISDCAAFERRQTLCSPLFLCVALLGMQYSTQFVTSVHCRAYFLIDLLRSLTESEQEHRILQLMTLMLFGQQFHCYCCSCC